MKIFIKTTAAVGCHVSVNIKLDDKKKVILNVSENGSGSVNLVANQTYRFEWFVFATKDGKATITVNVDPANTGLSTFTIENDYSAGDKDGNIFLFTLN
jgi:hypothetical protein